MIRGTLGLVGCLERGLSVLSVDILIENLTLQEEAMVDARAGYIPGKDAQQGKRSERRCRIGYDTWDCGMNWNEKWKVSGGMRGQVFDPGPERWKQ